MPVRAQVPGGLHRGEGGERGGCSCKALDWWNSVLELIVITLYFGGAHAYLPLRTGLPSSWAVGRLGHARAWAALLRRARRAVVG